MSRSPCSNLRAAQDSRFRNNVPVLQVTAMLVAVLHQSREGDATNLPLRQGVLVLAANVLHALALEEDALVGQNLGHVDTQDGLLDGEEAGELDGVVDEDAQRRVPVLGGGGGRDGVEEAVHPGHDALGEGCGLLGEALGRFAADES